ncbi:MAG: hypothetical protein WBQ50_09030 [Nocardioides sp.]
MRSRFRREPPAPADVVARAGLGRGERPLAAARATDGRWLLATRDALVLLAPAEGAAAPVRLPWTEVESADWAQDEDRLRVAEVGELGRPRRVHELTVEEPGELLAVLRERVTASIVLQRRVVVSGRLGLNVVARRAPNSNDDLTWSYQLDPGLSPDDPEVRALAERGVRAAAEELGLG